ncbi:MAG: hypothetical protein HQL03_02830 [Nitrospirae bacterium]|nr:hypothetical protein [Nitrospirota bacterium]MBF0590877.1 hypothetical protein [Nitrospirota bacterium]
MQMILESRVDRLENLMAEVIELHREFTHEMKVMKLEAVERDRKDKEAQEAFRKEIIAIKLDAEERDRRFEEWLKQDKKEREEEREASEKKLNKTRADIAKQLGTLVEDIIAPGTPPLIRQYFKCEPYDFRPRTKKRKGPQNCEVDLLLICDYKAFMIEVKSKPDTRDVDDILEKVKTLPAFFDECIGKQIIPMLASVVVADNIIAYATRKGLHVVAYRQWEYLDILNFDAINEKNKDTSLTDNKTAQPNLDKAT